MIKHGCTSDLRGKNCNMCNQHMQDCDGDDGYEDYNGEWLPVEQVQRLVLAEEGEYEYKQGLGI